jgi:hypothetical protein
MKKTLKVRLRFMFHYCSTDRDPSAKPNLLPFKGQKGAPLARNKMQLNTTNCNSLKFAVEVAFSCKKSTFVAFICMEL